MILDNVTYWRSLEQRARADLKAEPSRAELALHEAGHAVASIALGGRPLHIRIGDTPDGTPAVAHCLSEIQQFPGGDDYQWATAVVLWAGAVAAGTLAGALHPVGDIGRIQKLGRQYLVGRDDCSAFAGARVVVEKHRATIERVADEFLVLGELDLDTLTELTGHIRERSRS